MEWNNNFTIDSDVLTFKELVNSNKKYIVPVYQRPYEWEEEQIEKFINEMFQSFWGSDQKSNPEPLFYGTLQLSDNKNCFEIIDGQQRMTTLLLIVLVLKGLIQNNKTLYDFNFDWIKTQVNSGKEQEYLDETIKLDVSLATLKLDRRKKEPNLYKKNAVFIKNFISDVIYKHSEFVEESFDENDLKLHFLEYIFNNIVFVVLKTKASLSKTIQIFTAINTSGLPLGEEDIFKVRMYEYLRIKKNCNETVFDEINTLYRFVDEENQRLGDDTSIDEILDIYKFILIAKYKLPQSLYNYSSETFFEQLFDTLLNVKSWDLFEKSKAEKIEMSLKDIKKLINMRYELYKIIGKSAHSTCASNFIWYTRYSKFWFLPVIFLFSVDNYVENDMQNFIVLLNKLYTIYSIYYTKQVKEIRDFSHSLIELLLKKNVSRVMETIKEKIDETTKDDLYEYISGEITSNQKRKDLICRLSAMLHENYAITRKLDIEELREKLFETDIDIEHIQSVEDKAGNRIDNIWKTWGEENINSLGNLMVLEERINRQIQDNPYSFKITKYPKSVFSVVKEQVMLYKDWNLKYCKERKEAEVNKILDYLYE
jgi:uncharacterized protein with ParB-like and HNH nuclease domain